jgi:hypothetical protein
MSRAEQGTSESSLAAQVLRQRHLVMPGLLIALAGCGGCEAAERRSQNPLPASQASSTVEFRAKVLSVIPITRYSGKLRPVSADPRYAATVCLLDDAPELSCKQGQTICFGLHSPALTFRTDDVVGRTFRFRLCGKARRYHHLEAERDDEGNHSSTTAPVTEVGEPLGSHAAESKQSGQRPMDGEGKEMSEAFRRWRSVVPIIEEQVLERMSGEVVIQFRLKNKGSAAVSFESYKPDFVAGRYYRHPNGDPYDIEGDDRNIAIWFYPSAYYRNPTALHQIAADEEQAFTARLEVSGDMPDPVKVSICLVGPFVELNSTLGKPRKLRWVEMTASESALPPGSPPQSDDNG